MDKLVERAAVGNIDGNVIAAPVEILRDLFPHVPGRQPGQGEQLVVGRRVAEKSVSSP
jgi:hypothetical protein